MIAGRYSLEREIGRGGMGAVWLGRDEVLGRQVALKQIGLLPGADSTGLARAEREARLSARLNHPHVVAVFNFVVDADTDARWLVMEYVDGPTMAQLVREEGKLSPDDAAPLLWQAADALVAAHSAGIVHRDVKPSNILVDRTRRVKLTDFGIARIAADPSLTQTGLVTGSPAYLAPEVATGQRGDEAADVWSLGATMFHVLSGRAPYETGDHVLSTLYRIVNEEPPRLTDAGWMTPLLDATMVKDPSQRWSMVHVRDFLAGPPDPVTPAPAPVSPVSVSRRLSRPPKKGLLLAGLALSLVLALLLYAALPDDPEPTADPATDTPSASPTDTAPSQDPTPSQDAVAAEPTARGMESFIRDYVAALSSDPDVAWQMLTPKFQRDSGGLDTYREFWSGVRRGRVLNISADPRNLVVSYQVRFDNFENGPGPTVLDLVFDRGRYLIDGERTQGLVPAS
ncbi:MAG TPA: protein kinase [Nocardioidaceae bacterium]|nr:protein kinase [Nocardioidaceae bacterium]